MGIPWLKIDNSKSLLQNYKPSNSATILSTDQRTVGYLVVKNNKIDGS